MMKLRTKLVARLKVLAKQRDEAIERVADKAVDAVEECAKANPDEWAVLKDDATIVEHMRALAVDL